MADASVAVLCIRCGSRAHTTRDHDEGKIGPGAGAAAKKPGAKKAVGVGTDHSAGVTALYVHHDKCWARPQRSPGIPEVIEPQFRMQPFEDPCIASWSDRDVCLCKLCEKKRKKAAFVLSQKKKKIAERGAK